MRYAEATRMPLCGRDPLCVSIIQLSRALGTSSARRRGESMVHFLKAGVSAEQDAAESAKVRTTVEGILADIDQRGDEAVRDCSRKFDKWDPPVFRLSAAEIRACVDAMSARDIDDIKFAQSQIRNFAQIQKAAL